MNNDGDSSEHNVVLAPKPKINNERILQGGVRPRESTPYYRIAGAATIVGMKLVMINKINGAAQDMLFVCPGMRYGSYTFRTSDT